MTELARLEQSLNEAETALHQLMIGGKAQSIDYDGRRISYHAANIDGLRRHIAELKNRISILKGYPKRNPIHIAF